MAGAGTPSAVMEHCWQSSVPVRLRLAESEVTTVEQPPDLYFLVPRHSYLLSLLPKVAPFLQHVLPPGEDTPWMEHNSLPLKWNVPAGVLYDLLAGEGEVPWSLTLHYRGYPSGVLTACEGEASLRGALLNSLKEAAFICRGSSLRVMEMAPGAQEDLYRSVLAQDLPRYRSVVQSLQLAPVARGGRQPAVPLRVFLRAGSRGYLSSYEGIAYTSRYMEVQRPDGSPVTLGEALLPLVADYMGAAPAPPPASPATAAAAAAPGVAPAPESTEGAAATEPAEGAGGAEAEGTGGAEAEGAAAEAQVAGASGVASGGEQAGGQEQAGDTAVAAPAATAPEGGGGRGPAAAAAWGRLREVLVCGVSPPLETPVGWLHASMHAADFFLYVVALVDVNGSQ